MRYREMKPAKTADITKISQQQLAARDAAALAVKSDAELHGRVQRQLAVDIAKNAQQTIKPSSFDKAMAFRQFCIAKNAANADAERQVAKAKAWVEKGGAGDSAA